MLYLIMTENPISSLRHRIVEFAMLMKNKVRPLGTFQLGRACHLTGSGMAFPWDLIASSNLVTGHITEDLKLGIELSLRGHPPRFLSSANIKSYFLENNSVIKSQKTRWEHGHMAVIAEQFPNLLWQALKQRSSALIVLAMDLMIPPLTFYMLSLSGLLLISTFSSYFYDELKLLPWIFASGFLTLSLSIIIGWWFFGRHLLSLIEVVKAPFYSLWKLPIYISFFIKKRSTWKRTDRK